MKDGGHLSNFGSDIALDSPQFPHRHQGNLPSGEQSPLSLQGLGFEEDENDVPTTCAISMLAHPIGTSGPPSPKGQATGAIHDDSEQGPAGGSMTGVGDMVRRIQVGHCNPLVRRG